MTDEYIKITNILANDGVAVVPTDTIHGLVGRALSKGTVSRIYNIKGRDDGKPLIVLITRMEHLRDFGVKVTGEQEAFLERVWPGKVSVVLPVSAKKWEYLTRGTGTLAFRMVCVRNKNIHMLIESVGPLVAPSANPQGEAPAKNRKEARAYFGERVDGYICGGTRVGKPSTLVSLVDGKPKVLRQGSVKITDTK